MTDRIFNGKMTAASALMVVIILLLQYLTPLLKDDKNSKNKDVNDVYSVVVGLKEIQSKQILILEKLAENQIIMKKDIETVINEAKKMETYRMRNP